MGDLGGAVIRILGLQKELHELHLKHLNDMSDIYGRFLFKIETINGTNKGVYEFTELSNKEEMS